MLRVTAAAIFLSAALLFLVQPMAGKVLLPVLGGSPAVWNTCMVFFQGVLLLGYLYAHAVSTRVVLRRQVLLHTGVIFLAGIFLLHLNLHDGSILGKLLSGGINPGENPPLWIIGVLAVLVGPAFFAVSTTGPLLQRWFSYTDHAFARDPYFLYAASNAGSLLGLLSYPFLLEPVLTRRGQYVTWAALFAVLGVLLTLSGILASRREVPRRRDPAPPHERQSPPTTRRRLRWTILAFTPSSLMLGVTQHITTDIASVPLLWVIPLALYLLSFIWAFTPRLALRATTWGVLVPLALLGVAAVTIAGVQHPSGVIVLLHLVLFFVAAMMCHTALGEDRPDPEFLTEFYLLLSLGGVLGGVFNALAAPLIFSGVYEYPLVLALTCLLRPQVYETWQALTPRERAMEIALAAALGVIAFVVGVSASKADIVTRLHETLGFLPADRGVTHAVAVLIPVLAALVFIGRYRALSLAGTCAGLLAAAVSAGIGSGVIHQERTFFGVHYVISDIANTRRLLRHGTTLHGLQIRTDFENPAIAYPDPDFRYRLFFGQGEKALTREQRLPFLHLVPTTYYHPSGPIGDVMRELTDTGRLRDIALIGLGTGALVAYARPGVTFHVYEIDPAVIRIARDERYFRFITDALRDPSVRILSPGRPGDGRLDIARSAADGTYDLIVVDAFSSDAIPTHLLTREAVDLYMRKLKPHGILAIHISSRYFDLKPVATRIAQSLNMVIRARLDNEMTAQQKREAKRETDWVVLARTEQSLGRIAGDHRWTIPAAPRGTPLWTDDYTNIIAVFRGWGIPQD
jgi:hypothetical protein